MDTNTNDSESQGLTSQQVVDILQNGSIEAEHGMMRWSSNYTFLLSINHNDHTVMAVYKPQKGERPLWDFPDGMLCKREVASFLTSEYLGWQIVPPTVLRHGPHGLGSMQFFVEHDPELNYFEFDEAKMEQMRQICAFDILVNNADRKGGHCLVDGQGHVWGIDHGITFNSSPKLRTVVWEFAGEPIEDSLLADIERLCIEVDNQKTAYRQELNKLITEREIHAFQNRIQNLLKSRKYPQPGPGGPNYPWPPV
ncbi:MAG: SCO1664 family protein [Anaerolineaceae bacterium]|nr:SCO1664 family protein [Anaerolineaceae bacterium]